MTWLGLFVLIIIAALFAAVVKQAPDSLIGQPYRSWLLWLILVAVVVVIIFSFLGGGELSRHIPGTR
jgi:hypothetical protein